MDQTGDPIKVLVVDDHPLFRQGVGRLVERAANLTLAGEAANGSEALEIAEGTRVDVAVLDVDMPGMDGLALAERLLARDPPPRIILLTMHKNQHLFDRALDLGVSAYVLKEEAVNAIEEAISCAARGESYVSPALSQFVMNRGRKKSSFEERTRGWSALTPAEKTVLKLVAQNLSSKEIGAELGISARTVGTHRTNISQKLNLKGKHSLLSFALENKSAILAARE